MTNSAITVYTTSWCPYCSRLKSTLNTAEVPFDEIDIEEHPEAGEFVASVNNGNRVVPTVKFSDGSTLTNPMVSKVKAKLAELG